LSQEKPSGSLPKLFSNPWIGFMGTVASILGVALAVYFYTEGKEVHQLTYYVNPAKAVVVKAGQSSKLTVSFDNRVIGNDITAAQISLWNQGKLPIKRDDILKPITIYTENSVPILEATIRKTSRDVTQLSLNADEIKKGYVTISWNILEQNDGAAIQLIYAGDPSVHIYAGGIIEGQGEIKSESTKHPPNSWLNNLAYYGGLSLCLLALIVTWLKSGYKNRWNLLGIIILISLLAFGLYYDLVLVQQYPPFGP